MVEAIDENAISLIVEELTPGLFLSRQVQRASETKFPVVESEEVEWRKIEYQRVEHRTPRKPSCYHILANW